MSASNSWAEFAGLFRNTRQAFLEHERSKAELKALMPEDAKEAIGHPRQASDNRLRPGRIPPGRARAFRPARAAARGQRGPQRAEGFRW